MNRFERIVRYVSKSFPKKIRETEDINVELALERLEPHLLYFTRLRASLERCHHHLSRFMDKYPPSQKMTNLLHDYEAILRHADELEHHVSLDIQMWFSITLVEEARQSRTEAVMLRKLTVVLLIFVPLDYATLFFGLELDLLSTRSLKLCILVIIIVLNNALVLNALLIL